MKRQLPGQEEHEEIRKQRAQTNAEMERHLALSAYKPETDI